MATVQVIKKHKRNKVADTFGALGQGLSGFASGYMGKKRMDSAEKGATEQRALMERMFGKDGGGIQPMNPVQVESPLMDQEMGGGMPVNANSANMSSAPSMPGMGGIPGMGGAPNMSSVAIDDLLRRMLGGMKLGA